MRKAAKDKHIATVTSVVLVALFILFLFTQAH